MKEVAKDWRKLLSLLLIIALLMQVSPIQAFADRQDEAAVQGTVTAVKAGSNTLVTNSYAANNGLLTKQSYGNGFVVGHSYDSLDRESSRTYNSGNKFYWSYNADGNLARYTETGGRVLTYTYDDIGRLLQVSGDDGSYVKTAYDNVDKSTQLHYKFNGQRRDVYFNYDTKDNLPLNVKFGANSAYSVANTYDSLTRLSSKSYAVTGSGTLKTTYKYHDWASNANHTTGTVEGIKYSYAADGLETHNRWYTYDKAGNILGEYEWLDSSKPVKERYAYDSKNQLIRHDSVTQDCTIEYGYDTACNITQKNTYAYTLGELTGLTPTETVEYKYEDSTWHDLLTSYDGQAIEYDAIGNPTAYRGWTMSWQGRQLESAAKDGNSLSFTYDSDGIRTSKTVGTVKTSYLLNGTQILAQTTNGKTLCFFYDQQGSRVAMADSNNHIYYYLYNLQGDVIALADAATGKLVATYTYDAWGKIVKINNKNPETVAETDIAKINPFRYRGYYYDSETGLYYLQSRYYDAETGRFINADGQLNEGVLGYNMFAYCENNPVNASDPLGEWAHIVVGALLGGVSSLLDGLADEKDGSNLIRTVLIGAVSGGLSAAFPGSSLLIDIAATCLDAGLDIADSKEGQLAENVATGVSSVGFTMLSGLQESYATSSEFSNDIKSISNAKTKLSQGNHPKVKGKSRQFINKTTRKIKKNIRKDAVSGGTMSALKIGFNKILKLIF